MIRLFMNGAAASAGGGLTYLRNVLPHLARRSDCHTTVLLGPQLRSEFVALPNLATVEVRDSCGALARFTQEQRLLPKLIRQSGAQVLISAGNFALWNSPVPQILLSRNSLYTSADFARDLRARGQYSMLADTLVKGWIAKQSIRRAEIAIAPSRAFADDLEHWTGKKVEDLHHGFDRETFQSDPKPLPADSIRKLEGASGCLRLLFVSHYNYYRNFETLFRAMPILNRRLDGRVKLFLTCHLESGKNPGSYRIKAPSTTADHSRSDGNIVELGTIPYNSLHHLYKACNIYVSPAYAESFAHPLIEAMSSGLPVVASDLPVHREICGDAAFFFSRFSHEELAERILQIHASPTVAETLAGNGLRRARDFSWSTHVDQLLNLAAKLIDSRGSN